MSSQQTIKDRPWLYYSSSSETEALESAEKKDTPFLSTTTTNLPQPIVTESQKRKRQEQEEMPQFSPISEKKDFQATNKEEEEEEKDIEFDVTLLLPSLRKEQPQEHSSTTKTRDITDKDETTEEEEPKSFDVSKMLPSMKQKQQPTIATLFIGDQVVAELDSDRLLHGTLTSIDRKNQTATIEYLYTARQTRTKTVPLTTVSRIANFSRPVLMSKSSSRMPVYIGSGTKDRPIEILSDLEEESPNIKEY